MGKCKVKWFIFYITSSILASVLCLNAYGEWFNFKYIKWQLDYEDICTIIFESKFSFIINNELLKLKKIWTRYLIGLLKNSRIHIEFHSKLFIVIKHGLKN
jgi:hypothetical protein